MEAYRSGYANFAKINATIIAISTDDAKTQREFRSAHAPNLLFVADPKAVLVELYGVKQPLITYAKRTTFVVGPGRRIQGILTGSDALDPKRALALCGVM